MSHHLCFSSIRRTSPHYAETMIKMVSKKERKQEYYQRLEVKEKHREYMREYNQRPEVKEKRREYYQKNKEAKK